MIKTKGFSLLELVIYTGILAGLLVVVSGVFISLSRGNGQVQAKAEVNNAIRFATEMIRQDLKNVDGGGVSLPSPGSPGAVLTLSRNSTNITYDVSGGALRRKEGTAAPENVTNSNIIVSSPVFTYINNYNSVLDVSNISIKIEMTFTYNSNSPDWTYSAPLQTTVDLYRSY